MVTWGALIVGLLAFTALAFALFRGLLAAIVTQRINAFIAIAVYWLSLAVSVRSIWLMVIQFASDLYSTNPSFFGGAVQHGALVWVPVVGGCLSVAIGLIFAFEFSWRVWAHAKSPKAFATP
jgi:hypothetical protein